MAARRLALFVCTGNVCRSPMAERLLRRRLGPRSAWETASAGLSATGGMPASEEAAMVMAELGIDLGAHRSRPVDKALVDAASVIVVMTADHRDRMVARFPGVGEKLFLLSSFASPAGRDVEDPIGLSPETYRRVRDEMDAAMPELASFLRNLQLRTDA